MKITIENTSKVVTLNGVPARIWEGASEAGVDVICFITRIAVKKEADTSQFEMELEETRVPSPEAMAVDLRMIL